MPHRLKIGSHVWADFDGTGYVIGHVTALAHTNDAGEEKFTVQAPDGSSHELTHREPADLDAAGSGVTFKLI